MFKRIHLISILLIVLIFLFGCQPNTEPNEITLDVLGVVFDFDTELAHAVDTGYEAVYLKINQGHQITITLDSNYVFSNSIVLIINGITIDDFHFQDNQLIYQFDFLYEIDPNHLKDVLVTLDLNGGYFGGQSLDFVNPDETLTITTYDDILGQSLTVFDDSYQTLRWFYKLFIAYNEAFDAYEVVYADPATAAIGHLSLPHYDYIVAVHQQTQDLFAKDIIISYSENFAYPMLITFDQDIATYEGGDMTASFYVSEDLRGPYEIIMNTPRSLPTPIKEGFRFLGWYHDGVLVPTFPGFKQIESLQSITYTALWEGASLNDYMTYLNQLIPTSLNQSIDLPLSFSGFNITWSSSHEDVIDETGVYKKPYQATTVELTAETIYMDEPFILNFHIQVEGYKSLDGPIASSYIYRNYHMVNQTFFETLDVINTAFIIASDDGTLNGTNYLNNVTTHIMPQARLHGNWVIMSVAPESAWSTIAMSGTLIEKFANNIVDMINQYDFDGVDIDWETPTNSERTRYTNLMRVVYQKVKANNPNHLVTTAITGGMWQPPQYDLLNSLEYIDYINMMTYGMTSNNGYYQNALYRSTSYHYQNFLAGRTLTSCSIEESIDIFHLQYHVPYDKIIVGVAFYGIRQTRSFNQSTQTWTAWTNAGSVFYTDIIANYLNNPDYISAYDVNAGVPYIIKKDGTVFISYDNPRSITEKGAYIIENGLGGMMFWEYGADTSGTLLNALGIGLNKYA